MDLIRAAAMIDAAYTEEPVAPPPGEKRQNSHWRAQLDALTDTHSSVELWEKVLDVAGTHTARDLLRVLDKLIVCWALEAANGAPQELISILLQEARARAIEHVDEGHCDTEVLMFAAALLRKVNSDLDKQFGFETDYARERGEHEI
jgi:hypothetical protein